MNKSLLPLVALLIINATHALAGEKRNKPEKEKVIEVVNNMGAGWKQVDKVDFMKSILTGETYLHIFSAQVNKGANRIILFNNQQQYLGNYHTSYEPYKISGDGDDGAYVVICRGDRGSFPIPIGNEGPWEKVMIKIPNTGQDARTNPWKEVVLKFEASEHFVSPNISSTKRNWSYENGDSINGSLAMLTDDYIYIQLKNEAIQTIPRRYLSKSEQKYLKSLK